MDVTNLKQLLKDGNSEFWSHLAIASSKAGDFGDLFLLSSFRKKAHARGLARPDAGSARFRLAIVGGYSLYPLHELIEHLLEVKGIPCDLHALGGQYGCRRSAIGETASQRAFRLRR